ncbi:hypothetical protein [Nocardia sp. CDC160]|uniref:hypothetical protein n=1 Tax=Nocardia sp. CDC160 TaxID=3112166 RepID=UPI002DB556F9|nr:hypothetical protein [Nocardia sp. CDC160]MEC3915963.1 hypothetical protein [Nocardia sp. CDC160]
MTARGRVWFRRLPGDGPKVPVRITRAIALLAARAAASEVTTATAPESLFEAQQRLAIALGQWVGAKVDQRIEFRANLRLSLGPEYERRAQEYALARQAAHVEAVMRQERLRYLGEYILDDLRRAKLWWLSSQIDQTGDAQFDWSTFDKHITPLIDSSSRNEDLKVVVAEVISTLVDRVHDDPTKLQTWENMVKVLLNIVGEPQLGERLHPLFHPSLVNDVSSADPAVG